MRVPRFFCMTCGQEMDILQVGACIKVHTADNQPYYTVLADIYSCPYCKTKVSHNTRKTAIHVSREGHRRTLNALKAYLRP